MDSHIQFLKKLGVEYYFDADIRPYLTIAIGGKVESLIIINNRSDLVDTVLFLNKTKRRFILLGGGSNTLFSGHAPALNVIINRVASIEKVDDQCIRVASGISNRDLLEWCRKEGISGLEFLAGIPGTIGGAAAVNAGAFGHSISEVLLSAEIISGSEIRQTDAGDFDFSYRNSRFKYGSDVIVSLALRVVPGECEQVGARISEILKSRGQKHPNYRSKTAGCFFKNPIVKGEKISAGKLIEASGLKGKSFKRISVSKRHSNFIINSQDAGFDDIQAVERYIIDRILNDSGIKLEREVIYIDPDGRKY